MSDGTDGADGNQDAPRAESNGYQLKRLLANERAVAAGVASADDAPTPDRSSAAFERRRPLLGGQCIGPKGTSYGTLGVSVTAGNPHTAPGWCVWDDSVSEGDRLVTTNRHVADGEIGQAIYQPGVQGDPDGNDRIGEVVGYAKLGWPAAPDVAFIALDDGVEFGGYLADGMGDGVYRGGGSDLPGTPSRLSGATSGVATGTIKDGETTLNCNYGGEWGVLEKRGVYRASDNSQGGDSGSPSDDGPGSGTVHGLNFASSSGFQAGGSSWKVPVGLIEQAGVRVLADAGGGGTPAPGNRIQIHGSGPQTDYRIGFRGSVEPHNTNDSDTIRDANSDETGDRVAVGRVSSGTDEYRGWGRVTFVDTTPAAVQVDVFAAGANGGEGAWVRGLDPLAYGSDPIRSGGGGGGGGSGPDPPSGEWTPLGGGQAGRRWPDSARRPAYGVVNRHDETIRPRVVTIDPTVGTWEGEYSASDTTYGSIQQAANYVERDVNHEVVIQLPNGTVVDGEPGDSVTIPPIEEHETAGAQFHVRGDTDAPGDYVVDCRQFNTRIQAAPTVHRVGATLEGFTLRSKLSTYHDAVGLDQMRVENPDAPAIAGYGGYVSLRGGSIDAETLLLKDRKVVRMTGVTVNVSGALATTGIGGGTLVFDGYNDLRVGSGTIQGDGDPSAVEVVDPHGETDGLDAGQAIVRG